MKKLKAIGLKKTQSTTAVLLTAAMIITILFVSAILPMKAESAPDSEAVDELLMRVALLEANSNIQQMQIEALVSLMLQSADNTDLSNHQKYQAAESERYLYMSQYENACLSALQIELYKAALTLQDKRISVEKAKLDIGESTAASVSLLQAQKSGLSDKLKYSEQELASLKKLLSSREKYSGYSFIGDYSVIKAKLYDGTEEQLINLLLAGDSTLWAYDNQLNSLSELDVTNDIISTRYAEYEAQISARNEQLRWAGHTKYAAYLAALAEYSAAESMLPDLEIQRKINRAQYDAGFISELKMFENDFQILQEIFNASAATVKLNLALIDIELAKIGIVS